MWSYHSTGHHPLSCPGEMSGLRTLVFQVSCSTATANTVWMQAFWLPYACPPAQTHQKSGYGELKGLVYQNSTGYPPQSKHGTTGTKQGAELKVAEWAHAELWAVSVCISPLWRSLCRGGAWGGLLQLRLWIQLWSWWEIKGNEVLRCHGNERARKVPQRKKPAREQQRNHNWLLSSALLVTRSYNTAVKSKAYAACVIWP